MATGPRLAPASGRAPKQLVVLLHGYGADGNDLIELGRAWQPWLPDAAFFAPHAPDPLPYEAAAGRQWFPLTMRDPHERWRGVNEAAPGLDALIDAEIAAHGIDVRHLALVGFSQGTMMALHVGLRRPAPLAAIVGLSGLLVLQDGTGPESLAAAIRSRPPILLTHGGEDDVIPAEALFMSAGTLAAADIPCEWHLSAGVGHGIDEGALRHAGLFLARAFGLPFPG
jgi:phospholipase/carboxylesterase